jgi:pimeloyl-ACP methyl ester carboxylesterase
MPYVIANGIRLAYEVHGSGVPILCIHGTSSSRVVWSDAVARLAQLGRVIAYDRRGCGESERPEPYERTSVAEHADDAAALLAALGAAPAVVVGRSYGASIATDLALRHPECVRALVGLEGDAPPALAPATAAWIDALGERLGATAARDGLDAVAAAFIGAVAGDGAWSRLPEAWRRAMTANAPAILAEVRGECWPRASAAELATIAQPALLVAAADSPPELREPTEALARTLPNARLQLVPGGHLIDPAGPAILAFVEAACAA